MQNTNIIKKMIIGISGKEGSGKTTAALMIYQLTGGVFQTHSFARALKESTAAILGFDVDDLYDRDVKNMYLSGWDMTVGEFLQWLGTDVCRKRNSVAWVDALMKKYEPSMKWTIDDIRFKNEADAVKDAGGVIIRLSGDPGDVFESSKRDKTHSSEVDMDDYGRFDFVIDTDEKKGMYLREELTKILKKLGYMVASNEHRDFTILRQNFNQFLGNLFETVIHNERDLEKPLNELILDYIAHIDTTDSEVFYDLKTGTKNDITPFFSDGRLQQLTIQLKDQNLK